MQIEIADIVISYSGPQAFLQSEKPLLWLFRKLHKTISENGRLLMEMFTASLAFIVKGPLLFSRIG